MGVILTVNLLRRNPIETLEIQRKGKVHRLRYISEEHENLVSVLLFFGLYFLDKIIVIFVTSKKKHMKVLAPFPVYPDIISIPWKERNSVITPIQILYPQNLHVSHIFTKLPRVHLPPQNYFSDNMYSGMSFITPYNPFDIYQKTNATISVFPREGGFHVKFNLFCIIPIGIKSLKMSQCEGK